MATYKGVYFCDSDKAVWFEKKDDADRFDQAAEVVAHLKEILIEEENDWTLEDVVNRIIERYTISERWDYKQSMVEAVSDEPKEGNEA